jgi:hypothetical protein
MSLKGVTPEKKKINPTRLPIEEKESYRWLENVKQATGLFEEPQRCVHIGDRESDIYDCSVSHNRQARTFCCGPAWTG